MLRYTYIACLVQANFHSFVTPSLHDSANYIFRNSKQSKKLVTNTKYETTRYLFVFILFLFLPS